MGVGRGGFSRCVVVVGVDEGRGVGWLGGRGWVGVSVWVGGVGWSKQFRRSRIGQSKRFGQSNAFHNSTTQMKARTSHNVITGTYLPKPLQLALTSRLRFLLGFTLTKAVVTIGPESHPGRCWK
jgi:hypothetical protein